MTLIESSKLGLCIAPGGIFLIGIIAMLKQTLKLNLNLDLTWQHLPSQRTGAP